MIAHNEQDYWPTEQANSFTPLQMAIHNRKVHTFSRAAYALLHADDLGGEERYAVARQLTILIETRVIPEVQLLDKSLALEAGGSVVKVVIQCLMLADVPEVTRWATTKVCQWLHHPDPQWKSNMEKRMKLLMGSSTWPQIPKIFYAISQHIPDPDRKTVISILLPLLNDVRMRLSWTF